MNQLVVGQLRRTTIMEQINAKHVIIGAGAMGSAAAYQLARRGEPVVLIEQFALGTIEAALMARRGSRGIPTPTLSTLE